MSNSFENSLFSWDSVLGCDDRSPCRAAALTPVHIPCISAAVVALDPQPNQQQFSSGSTGGKGLSCNHAKDSCSETHREAERHLNPHQLWVQGDLCRPFPPCVIRL